MKDIEKRIKLLKDVMQSRLLVLDGAMGTSIQKRNLTPEDFGGADLDGCNENLLITRPEILSDIHAEFLRAGADVIETNTFGSTPLVLDEYNLGSKAYEISKIGAEIARKEADRFSTPERTRFVAGSMGPTTKAITVTGGVSFDELVEDFYVQAKGLITGGSDYLLVETSQDMLNIKAALLGIDKLSRELGFAVPVAVSVTIETTGTMLGGQTIDAAFSSVAHLDLLSFGLNCATGPSNMREDIRTLAGMSHLPISCVPNAGLPDEDGHYHLSPGELADTLKDFSHHGWLSVVGGCCGTTPDHITALDKMARSEKPKIKTSAPETAYLSGIDYLEVTDEKRPVLVGERTNVIGSRAFKNMIIDGKFEEAAELARKQVKAGADIIDICMSNPDRDEAADMLEFLPLVIKMTKAPLMIDSTDEKVIELALKWSQGKAIINSVNLEDGEERFDAVIPLAKKYGAALVVGCIDEDKDQGMGVTVERKLEIAERSRKILNEKWGIPDGDIYFDPLVFPVGTGDEQYILSAEATVKGTKAIKEKFPNCKTVLGISNVSFGLPGAGREVLNSVFLYHCVQAGLDLAIVNSQKLERYPQIPDEEKKLAEDLIFHTKETYDEALAAFAAFYKDKKAGTKVEKSNLTLDERLANYILEGSKDGLVPDLDLKLKELQPLEIINGPLMDGMNEVGRLFNNNELIVAEVLQSAEAMKAAVSHLEQFMDKSEEVSAKATILLATVKGDVHDIGKNLVDIILTNNGYKVINLGIKIPSDQILEAAREHKPDLIGLSGLLVKSAQQMVTTAEDLRKNEMDIPIIVGGAALTERFVRNRINPAYEGPVFYAKDAMSGLNLVNTFVDDEARSGLIKEWESQMEEVEKPRPQDSNREKLVLTYDYGIKTPQRMDEVTRVGEVDLDTIYDYINPGMLFKKHMGYKGEFSKNLAAGEEKATTLKTQMDDFLADVIKNNYFDARATFKFFRAAADPAKEDLIIFSDDGKEEIERFHFGRQEHGWQLSALDFVAPVDSGIKDHVALFVTTCGVGVRELYEKFNDEGEYLKSHMLQSLAIESAEGYAEMIHQEIRRIWGWPDPTDMTPRQIFQTKYHGIRLSFGYPACPELEQQTKLFDLLPGTKKIGATLTEEYMMEPEASVSAICFAHPEGRYFAL